jgi:hypothetical protein
MATAFVQEFKIVDGDTSTTNYDAVAAAIGRGPVEGLILHTAGFDRESGVFRIFDVWESREAGQTFLDERIMPIIERLAADAGEGNFDPPDNETWYDLHHVLP